jgi:hypothetical protein
VAGWGPEPVWAYWKRENFLSSPGSKSGFLGHHFTEELSWLRLKYIVTRFARQRDNNNVDSSDSTRKFIGTMVEITHNRYYTQFRV